MRDIHARGIFMQPPSIMTDVATVRAGLAAPTIAPGSANNSEAAHPDTARAYGVSRFRELNNSHLSAPSDFPEDVATEDATDEMAPSPET
ncbi:hypothetical protein DXG03_002934 [Asterophora parasitica]|uniref:Uncharacterized protein n=1 Tax=Asterophora parasitica TaxID=117018 RepID=A0A9P7GFY8_9AGAR|nr:hypothetical protein DXG03_002934 [Asterophora parasitica]